ncbi:MAG: tetratricopeptide repeat protein, partial [Anaerolineae bacterium]|nr:tetratricopeptide repeat protein [Anaerolineae bacterium]
APEVAPPVEEAVPVIEASPLPVEELVPGAVVEAAPEVVLPVEEVALPPGAELVKEQVVPVAEEVAPPSELDDLLRQLKARPRDYQLQLELARLHRDQRDWNAALKYYEKLISSRRLVPAVISDLEPLAETDVDHVRLYQLLGDAYMHEDRLDEALSMYRQARQALTH